MNETFEVEAKDEKEIKRTRGRPRKEIITDTEKVIKKKGRPRKVIDETETLPKERKPRTRMENPRLPGEPEGGAQYLRDYYINKLKNCLINFPNCNALTENINLGNHLKSKHCAKVASFLNTQSV